MSDKNPSTENEPFQMRPSRGHFFIGDIALAPPESVAQADGDDGETSRMRGSSGQPTPMGSWRPVPQRSLSGEEVGRFRRENDGMNPRPATTVPRGSKDLTAGSRIDVEPHVDHKRPADDDGVRRSPNPISGNYPGDLWRSHTRSGGVQSLVRSSRRVGGRNDCETVDD